MRVRPSSACRPRRSTSSPIRRPGWLGEPRGFAAPPRDGCAISWAGGRERPDPEVDVALSYVPRRQDGTSLKVLDAGPPICPTASVEPAAGTRPRCARWRVHVVTDKRPSSYDPRSARPTGRIGRARAHREKGRRRLRKRDSRYTAALLSGVFFKWNFAARPQSFDDGFSSSSPEPLWRARLHSSSARPCRRSMRHRRRSSSACPSRR